MTVSSRPWRIKASTAISLATVLFLSGLGGAFATPTPDEGPDTGGTTVELEKPAVESRLQTSMSQNTAFVIDRDGKLHSWGAAAGYLGQPGNEGVGADATLIASLADKTFVQVETDFYYHTLALTDEGQIYSWGFNSYGELGNNSTSHSVEPVLVQSPSGVKFTQIAVSQHGSYPLDEDGNAYGWGSYTTVGSIQFFNQTVPVPVAQPSGVKFTQITSNRYFAVALGDDGKLYTWGATGFEDVPGGYTAEPILVPAPSGVEFVQVSAKNGHALALTSDGFVYAWGENLGGQLGDGTTTDSTDLLLVPQPVGVTFTQVAAGGFHSLAMGDDGNVYGWGSNAYGQLAGMAALGGPLPDQVPTPTPLPTPDGVTMVKISGSVLASSVLGDDGHLYIAGYNSPALMGDGTMNTYPPLTRFTWLDPEEVVVTGVTFDGLDGTSLNDDEGTISVVTPAHAPGPVDVVLSWTRNGETQTPDAYTDGFTYYSLPTVTDPSDQSVADGQTAEFSVTSTGYPDPTVVWEVSTDNGTSWGAVHETAQASRTANAPTWGPVDEDPTAVVSADGLSLEVVGSEANNGYQYRAVAANKHGTAESAPASLAVTFGTGSNPGDPDSPGSDPDDVDDPDGTNDPDPEDVDDPSRLVNSGGSNGASNWLWAVPVLLGSVLLLSGRKSRG